MSAALNSYRLRALTAEERQGWLEWSLDFFTDPHTPQLPYLDITLALDVSRAWQRHDANRKDGASFFAWLTWSLLQTLAKHTSFLMRKLDGEWWVVENPPLVVPVAVGGAQRFVELVLPDGIGSSWESYAASYAEQLGCLRAGVVQRADWNAFSLGVLFGNLPNLAFTGLTLHSHSDDAAGRCSFYAGQRQWQGDRLVMPLAVKLHHATSDPWVLDQLLKDWRQSYLEA
ncbi:MAG: CatA-like O-acetyltransferase [Prochlorococcaceae cyanobacterium]